MAEDQSTQETLGEASVTDAGAAGESQSTRALVIRAVASAVITAIAFQARTMAYNNYGSWDLRFFALEIAVALGASCLVRAGDIVSEPGRRWACGYVEPGSGMLWLVLSNLMQAILCAVVMTALLSIANVAVVAVVFYRETVEMIPLAIIARFLADVPLAAFICLAVRMVLATCERRIATRE